MPPRREAIWRLNRRPDFCRPSPFCNHSHAEAAKWATLVRPDLGAIAVMHMPTCDEAGTIVLYLSRCNPEALSVVGRNA